LVMVEGDHNTGRPRFLFDSAAIFLQTCLQIPHDVSHTIGSKALGLIRVCVVFCSHQRSIPNTDVYNGGQPPWYSAHHLLSSFYQPVELAHGMTRERQAQTQQALGQLFGRENARRRARSHFVTPRADRQGTVGNSQCSSSTRVRPSGLATMCVAACMLPPLFSHYECARVSLFSVSVQCTLINFGSSTVLCACCGAQRP
jgi:hypothetical protein